MDKVTVAARENETAAKNEERRRKREEQEKKRYKIVNPVAIKRLSRCVRVSVCLCLCLSCHSIPKIC